MKRLTATLALWAGITAVAQAAEPITLGLNYPRTGPYKEEGLAQMRGALLAIDELNERGGVLGVVKHMPGHGRSMVDSHKETPLVTASAQELETDLAPFRALRDAPIAMTGHLRFTAWDAENPATLSPFVIGEVVRHAKPEMWEKIVKQSNL